MTKNLERDIIGIVARKTGVAADEITLDTRLAHDLGIAGDDARELLYDLSTRYQLDLSGSEASQYFRSEPSLLSLFPFLPSQKRDRLENKRPLTVGDLVAAVERKNFSR